MADRPQEPTREAAQQLDRDDPLQAFRKRFLIGDPDLIYLDGNSLGRTPKRAVESARECIETAWGERLIRGWNEGWMSMPFDLGDKISELVGARPGEVVVADSTSVNLFKLATAACIRQAPRTRIITDDLNFPSDLYILQGVSKLVPGLEVVAIPSEDGIHGPSQQIIDALDDQTALVTLSHTAFKSGFTYDMQAIDDAAHAAGAVTLWDLSHSVGAVPVDLAGTRADLAVGCTYKYLNGGPGSPAFLFVDRSLQEELANPVSGWMGQAQPFDFDLGYRPADGIARFLTGTPSILALVALEAGLEAVLDAGVDALREKSVRQSEFLLQLWERRLRNLGFSLNSPRDSDRRGSHISLGHPDGLNIDLALINTMKVLPDFRAPDNIRLGIAPLYTRYVDIYDAVERIETVVRDGLHMRAGLERPAVT